MSADFKFEDMFDYDLNTLVEFYFASAHDPYKMVAAYRAILVLHGSVLGGRLLSKVDIAYTVYFFALYNIRKMNGKTQVSVADIQNLAAQILRVLGNGDYESMKKSLEETEVYETLEFLQSKDCEFLLWNMVEEEEKNPGQMLATLKINVGFDNRTTVKQFVIQSNNLLNSEKIIF